MSRRKHWLILVNNCPFLAYALKPWTAVSRALRKYALLHPTDSMSLFEVYSKLADDNEVQRFEQELGQ